MCGRTDVVDTAHRAYSNVHVSVTVNCIQISHMIPLRYGNTSIRERLKSIQRLVNTNCLRVKIHHWAWRGRGRLQRGSCPTFGSAPRAKVGQKKLGRIKSWAERESTGSYRPGRARRGEWDRGVQDLSSRRSHSARWGASLTLETQKRGAGPVESSANSARTTGPASI